MGSGVVLVVLGIAVDLAPVVILVAGATIAVINVLHAKKRGYCPRPAEPGSPGANEDRPRGLHSSDERTDVEVGPDLVVSIPAKVPASE